MTNELSHKTTVELMKEHRERFDRYVCASLTGVLANPDANYLDTDVGHTEAVAEKAVYLAIEAMCEADKHLEEQIVNTLSPTVAKPISADPHRPARREAQSPRPGAGGRPSDRGSAQIGPSGLSCAIS